MVERSYIYGAQFISNHKIGTSTSRKIAIEIRSHILDTKNKDNLCLQKNTSVLQNRKISRKVIITCTFTSSMIK